MKKLFAVLIMSALIFTACEEKPDETTYDVGDTGPGGGIVFFAEGGQYKECSGDLGAYPWTDAVTVAKNHKGGGFTNWSLPDQGELYLMWANLYFNNLGGFVGNVHYWSSSEYSPSSARSAAFSRDGSYYKFTPFIDDKRASNFVRAVRFFSF